MGAFWESEDRILVSLANSGIMSVSPNGGPMTTVTKLDAEKSELQHLHMTSYEDPIWMILIAYAGSEDRPVMVTCSRETGERHRLRDTGTMPIYLASGHLLWSEGDKMYAAPCGGSPPKLSGQAIQILENVGTDFHGRSGLAHCSATGTSILPPCAGRRGT